MESLMEQCVDPPVEDEYDFGELFPKINNERLSRAIQSLSKAKKELLYKVFYERKKLKEIAQEEKVTTAAISARLQRIIEQLRLNM